MISEQPLLLGWASVDLTPERPVQLVGQHHVRVSEYVRDPVTATALALETRGGQDEDHAVIVSCDLAHVPRHILEELRARLSYGVDGLDLERIIIAATHTHTGPTVRVDRYPAPGPGVMTALESIDLIVTRLAEVVRDAWAKRQPGCVSWGFGHAALGFNRRVVYDDGTAKMYGSSDTPHFAAVEGANDHGVEMLFSWDEAQHLTGILINPACPSQVVEMKRYISADYWNAARRLLRERYSDDLYVRPLCSAAGDQSPRDLVRRGRGEADFRDESGLEEMGRRVSWAVDDVMERARREVRDRVAFGHTVESLPLPARKVTEADYEEAKVAYTELVRGGPTANTSEAGRARRFKQVMDKFEQQGDKPEFPIELHVLRIGDIALATNPFELFLDYGLRIKAQSPAEQTFLVQLACDRGAYLPTRKALAGGSYGSALTEAPVGPDGGDVLVKRTVELISDLWRE